MPAGRPVSVTWPARSGGLAGALGEPAGHIAGPARAVVVVALERGPRQAAPEPDALAPLRDREGDAHRRVDAAGAGRFHPKAQLFRHPDGTATSCVGNSNRSATALGAGLAWNYRVVSFRRVRPRAVLGRYPGADKAPEADVRFASIQTLDWLLPPQGCCRRFTARE